jgi:hypothetical protein
MSQEVQLASARLCAPRVAQIRRGTVKPAEAEQTEPLNAFWDVFASVT